MCVGRFSHETNCDARHLGGQQRIGPRLVFGRAACPDGGADDEEDENEQGEQQVQRGNGHGKSPSVVETQVTLPDVPVAPGGYFGSTGVEGLAAGEVVFGNGPDKSR